MNIEKSVCGTMTTHSFVLCISMVTVTYHALLDIKRPEATVSAGEVTPFRKIIIFIGEKTSTLSQQEDGLTKLDFNGHDTSYTAESLQLMSFSASFSIFRNIKIREAYRIVALKRTDDGDRTSHRNIVGF